ncbi:hypothetical protein LCGC14_0436550 [marine sediment metagenome]|uniref:Uncharacterized protein n=1 Tax=marine sediment metagenome TaxID=412755 RepID=A0A0F9V8K0_9ZZZZ
MKASDFHLKVLAMPQMMQPVISRSYALLNLERVPVDHWGVSGRGNAEIVIQEFHDAVAELRAYLDALDEAMTASVGPAVLERIDKSAADAKHLEQRTPFRRPKLHPDLARRRKEAALSRCAELDDESEDGD